MKIELKKVNEPDGSYWYGIWVDESILTPSYGTDLEAAQKAYDLIKENSKTPLPRYETIKEETL